MEETPQTQNAAENNINPPVNPNGYGDSTLQPEQIQEFAAQGTTPLENRPVAIPDAFRSEARTPDADQPDIKFGADLSVGKVQEIKENKNFDENGEPLKPGPEKLTNTNDKVLAVAEKPMEIEPFSGQSTSSSGAELLLSSEGNVKENWNEPSANPFFTDPKPPATN